MFSLFGTKQGDTKKTRGTNTKKARGTRRIRRTRRRSRADKEGGKKPQSKGNVCFPGDAKIVMESGKIQNISEIRVGDRVQTPNHTLGTVIFVPHEYNDDIHDFIELKTRSKQTIRMTENHYVPVLQFHPEDFTYSRAVIPCKDVCIGDRLILEDVGEDDVTDICIVQAKGVYSFTTDQEFIVVDGVVASSFAYSACSHETMYSLFSLLRWSYRVWPEFNAHPSIAKCVLGVEGFFQSLLS